MRQRQTALTAFLARGNRALVYRDSISREYAQRRRREARIAREAQRDDTISEHYVIIDDVLTRVSVRIT